MKKSLLALCFACCWFVSVAQEYVITRRMKNASNPTTNNNADYFLLPATLCGESKGATECPLMGGRKIGDCQCACDMKDERNITYKSTFGFYDGEWQCENNTAMKNKTGCVLYSYNSMNDLAIPTISQSHVSFDLMSRFKHRRYCFDLVGRRPHENSTYQKCNGTWEGLNRTILEKKFEVHWHFLHGHLFFQPSQLYPLPAGRLIRLVFECRDPIKYSMCFLLKVNGNLKCSVPSAETTTFRPSTTAPPSSSWPTSSRTNDTLNSTIRASISGKADPSTLIAGSVLGVVTFVILIAVITVIAMKRYLRKRRTNSQRQQNAVKGEELKKTIQSTDNPGYANTERFDIPSSSVSRQPTNDLPYEYGRRRKASRPPTMAAPLKGCNERIYDEPHAPPNTSKPSYTLPNMDRGIYQQLDPSSRREPSEYQTLYFKNETDA